MILQVSSLCVFLLIVGSCWADQQQQLGISSSLDAESINDLAKKPVKLDPKLRKALLKVLNRLEEEDRVTEVKLAQVESQNQQFQQQQQQQFQQQQQQQQQQQRQREQQYQRKQIRLLDQQQIQILSQQQIQLQDQQKRQLQDQEQRLELSQDQEQSREQSQDQGLPKLQSQDQRQNPQLQLQLSVQEPTGQLQQEQQVFTPAQTPAVAFPTSTVALTTRTEALPSPTVALPTVSPKTVAVSTSAASTLPALLPTLLPPTPNTSGATKSVSIDNAPNNVLRTTPSASIAPPSTDTGTVVDFFEAPLLTAFTVQQDSAGVPRRVIPIFTEPGQLERQKILALETRAESGDGGDRNTVEPDRNELEFLKSVELSKQQLQSAPPREGLQQRESFAVQQQLRFQQQLQQRAVLEEQQRQQQIVQQRQLQQQKQQQQQQQQKQQQQQQQQQQQRAVVFQPQQQQQQLQLQLQPVQGQQQPNRFVPQQRLQFGDGPLVLLPQFAQQNSLQQQRVLRQPQPQTFGYGLSVPRLPGDLDVVYKVLALNHEGRNDHAVRSQPLLF